MHSELLSSAPSRVRHSIRFDAFTSHFCLSRRFRLKFGVTAVHFEDSSPGAQISSSNVNQLYHRYGVECPTLRAAIEESFQVGSAAEFSGQVLCLQDSNWGESLVSGSHVCTRGKCVVYHSIYVPVYAIDMGAHENWLA